MPRQELETEIKFNVPPDFLLPALPGQSLPPRRFISTYYDTATQRLARHGLTLRYRSEARRGCWQLKIPQSGGRLELEFPGRANRQPDELRRLLAAYHRGDEFTAIAKLRTHRTGYRIRCGSRGEADIVLDAVTVLDGRTGLRRFSQVELEHRGVPSKRVKSLVRRLEEAGAQPIACIPKVFHALGLPFRVDAPTAPSDAAPAEQLSAALQALVHQLLLHDPGTRLGTDREHLHQMRVATRKLRAILRAARPMVVTEWADALRAELAWLGGVLGVARDLDVLLAHLRTVQEDLPAPERAALQPFCVTLTGEREAAQSEILKALQSERYLKLLERLESAAAHPEITCSDISLVDLARAEYRRLKRALLNAPDDPEASWLHGIRIKGKRARYAAELAQPGGGRAWACFIDELKRLQNLLGDHQDALTAEQRLRAWARDITDPLAALTIGRVIERQSERRRAGKTCLPAAWTQVKKRAKKAWRSRRQ